ncbi:MULTISPECIES: HNH endonuclease [Pseudomonas]|uniref:HNH endonuclease n=1 Tax=Pseudomonas TaxID=286 RepID=UPI000B1682A8|nr:MULTISPECIES: HNH endonuclease [Pseudomonas]MBB4057334.1 5-methylcytosine-specific restriction endonuclease McrA [Pseudomonas koreensis]TSB50293.1 HNH endonuclease [Pseudomonas sp. ef1]
MSSFDIIKRKRWGSAEKTLILAYFTGAHKEWTKANLKLVRDSVRKYLLRVQRHQCAYCRRGLSAEIGRNEIDHVVAKALPGMARFTYEHSNLVATCKRCNWLKRNYDVLTRSLLPTDDYPLAVADYRWIHPYIHRYSDHIEIISGYLYREVGDAASKARGKKVIDICKLNSLGSVESRRMFEMAQASESHHSAIMHLVSDNTKLDIQQLAKIVRRARPAFRKLTEPEIIEIIEAVRDGASEVYLRATARFELQE